MKYCVIVCVNRNQVTFYYQQQGCKVMPLEYNGVQTHPLYFYSDNYNFSFGTYAKQQFLNGNPHSFGNYFDEITHPTKSFDFYSNEKQIKYLLYHAVESALNYFLNTVLYETKQIESYRGNFPLRFVFESDVQDKEKIVITQLFSEAGFQNLESFSLNRFLLEEIIAENTGLDFKNTFVKLQSLNGVLYVQYFEKEFETAKYVKVFPGLGNDPRLRITAELLYYKSLASSRVVLQEEEEIFNLINVAKEFLENPSSLPSGTITLSDGSRSFVRLKKSEIDQKLFYMGFENKLYKAIDGFLDEFEIQQNDNLKMVLVGAEVSTPYFIDKLSNKYVSVMPVRSITVSNALEKIALAIEQSNYRFQVLVPEIPKLKQLRSISPNKLPKLPTLNILENTAVKKIMKTTKSVLKESKKPSLPPLPDTVKQNKINSIPPPPIPGLKKKK